MLCSAMEHCPLVWNSEIHNLPAIVAESRYVQIYLATASSDEIIPVVLQANMPNVSI